MKTSLNIMTLISAIVITLIGALSIVFGSANHNDRLLNWGGIGTIGGIILLSIWRALWSENKHKHENAMHWRQPHR